MFLIVAGICSLAFGLPLGFLLSSDKHRELVRRAILADAWIIGLAMVGIFTWPALHHPVPHWHYGILFGALGVLLVTVWTDPVYRLFRRP
jgi:ABC-type sugar transport system permease subunit